MKVNNQITLPNTDGSPMGALFRQENKNSTLLSSKYRCCSWNFCGCSFQFPSCPCQSLCLFRYFMNLYVNNFTFGSWVPLGPHSHSDCSSLSAGYLNAEVPHVPLGLFSVFILTEQFYWLLFQTQKHNCLLGIS